MLSKLKRSVVNSKQRLLDLWLSVRSIRPSPKGLCCISIAQNEFAFAYAQSVAGKTTLEFCQSYPCQDTKNLTSLLSKIVKDNHLKRIPCALIMQPEEYQLLVIDTLPVTESEFQAAIRWKIKDLIHFPLSDIAVDSFLLPPMNNGQKKMMVAVSSGSKLKIISDQIRACGLDLKYINISELTLANISTFYEKADNATFFIYVQETTIQLLITLQKQLFVSRQLKFNLNMENEDTIDQGLERIASEVQRSFDYYQNLWDKPVPSHFIFDSSKKLVGVDVCAILAKKIQASVEKVNIKDLIACSPRINMDDQGKYLPLIGRLLTESPTHATTN